MSETCRGIINQVKQKLHLVGYLPIQYALHVSDAKGVRNMWNILVVVNKHNTARVASYWFIIYYILVMHGNSKVKFSCRILN